SPSHAAGTVPSAAADSAKDGAEPFSEPAVPGSTIDLGDTGPSKNLDRGPEGTNQRTEETGPGGGAAEPPRPEAPPSSGNTDADRHYMEGYAQFNSGDFTSAERSFQAFLSGAPDSDLADDAQYWIGECFFSRKDFRRAILEFRKVIDQYPFGNRVPHAFLKLGLSYLALGDRERASENLETVVQAFPKSDVATVARATLDQIGKP